MIKKFNTLGKYKNYLSLPLIISNTIISLLFITGIILSPQLNISEESFVYIFFALILLTIFSISIFSITHLLSKVMVNFYNFFKHTQLAKRQRIKQKLAIDIKLFIILGVSMLWIWLWLLFSILF